MLNSGFSFPEFTATQKRKKTSEETVCMTDEKKEALPIDQSHFVQSVATPQVWHRSTNWPLGCIVEANLFNLHILPSTM